jgi:hypothetical protein
MNSECFEIVVKGRLSPTLVGSLGGFDVIHIDNGRTHMVGWIIDQCRLRSLLASLDELCIEIISLAPSTSSLSQTGTSRFESLSGA